MRKIPLSENHRERLIEMCMAMFPEYDKIVFDGPTLFLIFYERNRKQEHIFKHRIYWFELCFMDLAEKIIFKERKRATKENYLDFVWDANLYWDGKALKSNFADHPIDYLYRTFKQLK